MSREFIPDMPPQDDADPLLDALLEELLGGCAPPDMSQRILTAASQLPPPSARAYPDDLASGTPQLDESGAEYDRIERSAANRRSTSDRASAAMHRRAVDRRRTLPTLPWLAALTAAVAGLWLAWSVQRNFERANELAANAPSASHSTKNNSTASNNPANNATVDKPRSKGDGSSTAPKPSPSPTDSPAIARDPSQPASDTVAKTPPPFATEPDESILASGGPNDNSSQSPDKSTAGKSTDDPPHSAGSGVFAAEERAAADKAAADQAAAQRATAAADSAGDPASDRAIIDFINLSMRKRYASAAVTPSAPASDAEWLRRVYLGIIGRIPTLEEFEAFTANRSPNRRESAVDQLLDDGQYTEEYSRNWTNVYSVALAGQMLGDTPGELLNRTGLQQYLRRAMRENKSLDQLATDLLTATGTTRPGDDGFNGATNFLVDKLDDGGIRATAKTAQVFLGIQIQCTQCHNHPFNDWKQSRFWELASFFRQAHTVKLDSSKGRTTARLTDVNFRGEGAGHFPGIDSTAANNDDAEIYYEERSGRMKAAYPVFIDGTAIPRSGEVAQVNRRQELARLMTSSPMFAQAAVNRLWSHFFGYGFTRSVDDMGPHSPPSHPELLERLSRELASHHYDLKSMIRWIALSEPYSLSSRPSRDNAHDDPVAGHAPLFSRYYLRQMRAEQLYDSLVTLSAPAQRSFDDRQRDKAAWMRQFVISYQTDECDECSLFVGSIPQTLSMMNGQLVMSAIDSDTPGTLGRVARSTATDMRKIQQLFAAALGRNPTPTEITAARRVLASHGDHPTEGFEDLWWALLNSNEFILDR